MKRNICSIGGVNPHQEKKIIKTLGLSLAIALVLAPVANLAVVRDNVGGMDTSVSQEGNTPNGGATADQILEGYGAYVDGVLVEGNIPTVNVTDTTINNLNDTVTIPGHTYIDEDLTIGLSSSFLKDATNGATATANKMLQGETAYVNGELITGTIPSLAAKTYTPGTTNQTIASGKYLSGAQTIKGDSDLKDTNIKAGVEIFGVTGNSNVIDTSAGTAVASQILKDKVAYVDGSKITGTMLDNSGQLITPNTTSQNGEYILANIPIAGYYDTNSQIQVPVSVIIEEKFSKAVATSSSVTGAHFTYTATKDCLLLINAFNYECWSSRHYCGQSVSFNILYGKNDDLKNMSVGSSWGDNNQGTCRATATFRQQSIYLKAGDKYEIIRRDLTGNVNNSYVTFANYTGYSYYIITT